jgi:hypothetical protein
MSQATKQRDRTVRDGRRGREDDGEERLSLGRHILSASPLVWVLLVGAVAWALWATATRGSSSSSESGLRAVLVPTAGGDRMVVALPCGGGGSSGRSNTPAGGTSTLLPAGSGLRVVLVPGCQSSGGSAAGGSSGSSQAGPAPLFVLPPGAPAPKPGSSLPTPLKSTIGAGRKVTSAFTAPSGAKLLLVAPCQSKGGGGSSGRSSTAPPVASGHGVLVAPTCSG